ncbi:MAG: ankyrin repeat domain-containing protein [Ethanoligenens sp.]
MNRKKQLHYIYKDTLRHITSYPDRWKRFLKFCDQVYPMSFENMVLLYGQSPKVTLLATEEQWKAMGRDVLDNSKELFAFDTTSGDEIHAAKFFDVKQTNGEPVPERWRLDEDTQRSYLSAINRHRSEPADSVERYLRDMIAKNVQNYGAFAEDSFLRALRDREYNPEKVAVLQKSFRPMLERNIRYLVGNRCGFPTHSLPATGKFRYIRDFNDVYSATLFGVVSTDMARAVLTRVEHYVQRLDADAKENLIYETELYQTRAFSISRNSNLERSEGRLSAGESREENLQTAEAGEQVELYDAAGRRRADGQDAPGRGNSQSETAADDRGSDVKRAASGGFGSSRATDAGNPESGGRADYPGDGSEFELTASNTSEPSKDGSIFMPEIVMEEELATVLLCLPEQPPAEKQMGLSADSLHKAVGGPYMEIGYKTGVSCICKPPNYDGYDAFNRVVSGELTAGPIVFVHTNPDGSYTSLSPEELHDLKLKFAAPLTDVGREMDLSHALLDAVQTNDGEKVSRMLIGHKEDANKLIAGATPLHYAVEHGADKSVAALLKKGAYVDAINENRKTPLFRAVERGDAKMTRQLLKAGADPELSDGKRFIQDISASKAIKSMLDEYTVNKQNGLGRGMSPRSSRRR